MSKKLDGIKCQVNLSLETLMHYQNTAKQQEDLRLGEFLDTCVESFFKDRGVEKVESPFKVEGKVNLGTIDLQQEREEARAELERRHLKELDVISDAFHAYINTLNEMIKHLHASFNERIAEIKEIAKSLKES